MDPTERVVSPQIQPQDVRSHLRPQTFGDYVGQDSVVRKLRLMMQAAQARGEPLEHVLFHGPPGLGQTTLAFVVGQEMNAKVMVTSGPSLERTGDLAALLTNLGSHDILFVDEIHRLPKIVEEMLYPALEDFRLDLIIGQGPMARTAQISIKQFTLIGATTRVGLMSKPLRDRFGAAFRLEFYDPKALAQIVAKTASRLSLALEPDGADVIATRSRGTPRIANRLVRRVRDYADVSGFKSVSAQQAIAALSVFEIDAYGCDPMDRNVLRTVIEKFGGGPVGIETIASCLSEDVGTLEDFYEPYLIQLGMIKRTARGRVATPQAYTYLGLEHPGPMPQDTLF